MKKASNETLQKRRENAKFRRVVKLHTRRNKGKGSSLSPTVVRSLHRFCL